MKLVGALCTVALLSASAALAQGASAPSTDQVQEVSATVTLVEGALAQIDALIETFDVQLLEMQDRMDDASGAERDRLQGLIGRLTEKLDATQSVRDTLAAHLDAARTTLSKLKEPGNG